MLKAILHARLTFRQHFLSLLASVLSSTQYLPHEYAELVLPNVQTESVVARSDPRTLSLDLAHQLAFRRGLGNSLFAQEHSPVSIDDVRSFGQQAFAKSNIAVLGGGISTEALSAAVSKAFGGSAGGASSLNAGSSKYFGGETRVAIDTHHSHTHQPTLTIAYGSASAPSADLKVLPHLIGGASSVKWCAGTSPLSLAAEKIPGSKIETNLLPYSDASLFTVTITAPTSQGLKTLAQEVSQHVKSLGEAKDEGVKKAIAQAKVAEASKFGTSAGLLSVVAPSVRCMRNVMRACADVQIFKGEIPSADSSFSALDNVSASSVSKVCTGPPRCGAKLTHRPPPSSSRLSQQSLPSVTSLACHTGE